MKFTLSQADVSALSDDQQKAIFDALVVSIMADGKIEPAEIARFEKEITQVNWGKDEPGLMKMAEASRDRVLKLQTEQQVTDFVADVAGKIPEALREKIFRMMASLAFADREIHDYEKGLLNAFQEKFGIPDERLPEIAAEVKAGN